MGSYQFLKKKKIEYSYTYETLTFQETPYFRIEKEGKTIEGIYLQDSDFPITIRNYRKGDAIRLRFGTKKVSRFFVDRKISPNERQLWPVVENKNGKIVFVCGIGCDIEHYGNNFIMFVVK